MLCFIWRRYWRYHAKRSVLCSNVKQNSLTADEAVGELCLDVKIYLEALEAVHAARFGEGVQVRFCILSSRCEASKQQVIT